MTAALDRRFSVAPMLDWTDRHCRYFLRLLTRHTLLYTEMITTGALLYGDAARHLRYDAAEHPLAVQLGGSEPHELARCARLAQEWGYDEVNLNVGCPSDRVQSGAFGACLMAEPQRVADGVKAMRDAVDIPITVKHRIGIDARDSYPELVDFVGSVAAGGCETFIVHARKAWLSGLSPKENREVPPLRYAVVADLKRDFPALRFVLNGGIQSLDAAVDHLRTLDGVMLGRAAYHDPYLLAEVDLRVFADPHPIPSREAVIEAFIPYVETQLAEGLRLNHLTRHILGLYQNIPGAKHWRRHLSEHAHRADAGVETLLAAIPDTPR